MQNILLKKINTNIEIEVWPCKDNSAVSFTDDLSKPSLTILTTQHCHPGLSILTLTLPPQAQSWFITLFTHSIKMLLLTRNLHPPLSFPTPNMPAKEKKAKCLCWEGCWVQQWVYATCVKLTDRVVTPVRVALVLEGSVCADQGPDPPWLRGLTKAHVFEMESEETQIEIALL